MTITDRFKTPLDLDMEKDGWTKCTYISRLVLEEDLIDVRDTDIMVFLRSERIEYRLCNDRDTSDGSCKTLYVRVDNYERARKVIQGIENELYRV